MTGTRDGFAIPQGGNAFHVTEHWVERVVVVAASGDIDMLTAPRLAVAVYTAIAQAPAALVVDLTAVTFLASAGMNLLLTVQFEIDRFAVIAHGRKARRPLELTGIDTVVTVYRSLADGLAALAGA